MVKIFILIIGIVFFVVGVQDLIRIVMNPQDPGIWGSLTNEYSLRIVLNLVLICMGITDAILSRRINR